MQTDAEKVLNVYNWSDYIDEAVIKEFETEYGIKVNYDVFDSNEVVEAKLLAGSTGYDIVVPSASFLERQITAGVFQPLDTARLSNLKNLDADITQRVALHDPGNKYSVNYLWGTSGVAYNEEAITYTELDLNQLRRTRARLPLLRDERTNLVVSELQRILEK